jgi:prepilin-type N-terminal cleavage/methylation domain-containing protein
MIQKPFKRVPRPAFTLVELLVVMSIIAILVSLFVGAAIQVLKKVDETRNRNDITQLAEAEVNFQTKFNVDYMPSRIRLLDSGSYDISQNTTTGQPNNPLDYDSYNYIKRLWPRLQFPVDWNQNGVFTDDVILEGDQCLVFFLGGINGQGFSSNELAPTSPSGSRVGPFFEFKTNRLVDPGRATSPGYRVYIDAYGKLPFAYLSSYKTRNGYNRYYSATTPQSDCASLGVYPYCDRAFTDANGNLVPGVQYYNPETFQIISAGYDKKFGPGGAWAPGAAISVNERDDMANFYENVLGH